MESNPKYKRILIKLSGEFLKAKEEVISFGKLNLFTEDIKHIHQSGVQIGIVIGGGNILRGLEGSKKYKISSGELDELGMIATMINGGALSLALNKLKIPNSILSALPISPSIGEKFSRNKAIEKLNQNKVLIFVGGTGNPFYPNKFADAKFYETITYKEALNKGLKIMDLTAFSLAMEHKLPIIVFNGEVSNNLRKLLSGKNIGTIIKGGNDG
ncbi:MAG: UMP kinase [candidate division WOR-3 bacterium]